MYKQPSGSFGAHAAAHRRRFGAMDPAVAAALLNAGVSLANTSISAISEGIAAGQANRSSARQDAQAAAYARQQAAAEAAYRRSAPPPPVPAAIPWGPIALGGAGLLAAVLLMKRPAPRSTPTTAK